MYPLRRDTRKSPPDYKDKTTERADLAVAESALSVSVEEKLQRKKLSGLSNRQQTGELFCSVTYSILIVCGQAFQLCTN